MTEKEHGADDVVEREIDLEEPQIDDSKSAPEDRAEHGPYDAAEVPAMRPYIDLGGMKVAPREGLGVRLDVEEQTRRIMAISLDYNGSTLQVQAFAAPKSTGLWNEARAQLAHTLTQQGAEVVEQTGNLGPELRVGPPAGAEGQRIRFIGVDGPRWMIRGVIVGPAADDSAAAEPIEAIFREIVVVRGEAPMPPSELLPLKMPAGMQAGEDGGNES